MKRISALLAFAAAAIATSCLGQPSNLASRLEALANRGNAEARYHLAMLYNNGIGVGQDNRRAFALFRSAAAAGDPLAAYKVGCYYANEFPGVVPPDAEQALRYKLIAAEAGYALAQLDVANRYTAREDYARALPWYEAAARQGESQVYNLSVFYTDGLGVARSPARAYAYFRLAHLVGRGSISPGAQESLQEMRATMTENERADADRLGENWVPERTPLTRQAFEGQSRAEALVRSQGG